MGRAFSWVDAWREALASTRFRVLTVAAPVVVTAVLLTFRRFLDFVEARPGAVLADPILPFIVPHEVSALVFTAMYLGLVMGLAALARTPDRFVAGLWAYGAMIAVRMLMMYVVPLDPPPTLVPLRDPFVELFGSQRTLTRDLFFSGHTATMFLLALATPGPRARALLFAATCMVAAGVLIHAHYTADVLVAPFVSFGCWCGARRIVGITAQSRR